MIHKSHLGVYALIYNDAHDAVLVIKKARGPYMGRYDLPGGSLEDGELLEQTLAREILEETGCLVTQSTQHRTISTLFDYTNDTGDLVRFRHVGVIYTATISGTPRTMGDGQDSNGCIWLTIAEIAPHNTTPLLFAATRA